MFSSCKLRSSKDWTACIINIRILLTVLSPLRYSERCSRISAAVDCLMRSLKVSYITRRQIKVIRRIIENLGEFREFWKNYSYIS